MSDFSDITKLAGELSVPAEHTVKATVIGISSQEMLEPLFGIQKPHGINLGTLDLNAIKKGLKHVPLVGVIYQGDKDGHTHISMLLPTEGWDGDMAIPRTIADGKDVQRAVDWTAGFFEPFCFNGSITAFGTQSDVLFGDTSIIASAVIQNNKPVARPWKDIMSDEDRNVGEPASLVASLRASLGMAPKKAPVQVQQDSSTPVPEVLKKEKKVKEETEASKLKALRKTQQEVLDKYGYEALKQLLVSTKQPLLIDNPKI